jgi:type IV pilus assembly protein PilA
MNREFTAKLLRHLNNKKNKNNKGFTLIELLVVVIIIGVLAAVALPNLLSQVGKARESEAKNAMGTINRSQQAYHFSNRTFAGTIPNGTADGEMGGNNPLGVMITSRYYNVSTTASADPTTSADATAEPQNAANDGVRDYSAQIVAGGGNYGTAICQGLTVGSTTPTVATAELPASGVASSCSNDGTVLQ